MNERIVFADGTVFPCPEQSRAVAHPFRDRSREWKLLCVCGELPAVKEKFVDGAVYFHEWDSLVLGAGGKERNEVVRQELSEYSIAGDLVDSRDGTISVYMGKPTVQEEAAIVLEVADALAEAAAEVASGRRSADSLGDMVSAYNSKKEKHGKTKSEGKKPKP